MVFSNKKKFNHWQVYVPDEISEIEYTRGVDLKKFIDGIRYESFSHLHLKTSIRSFRSENVAKFVKALLDCDKEYATKLYVEMDKTYPIVITRNILIAKEWLKQKARSNERFGLVASSKAQRLKPYGIFVELKIDPKNWFLNLKNDVRSSYFLEYVATEFDIQGLELDWVCIAWDADFRFLNHSWNYYQFRGQYWQEIRNTDNILYLKNTYRVLLTRARQGLIIFIPKGDKDDQTRKPQFYDETYEYLKEIGLKEII